MGLNSVTRWALAGSLCLATGTLPSCSAHAQLSLYTAVDLARRNSPSVHLAQADVARATAALAESRDVYLPSASIGSSIGYSYGFPVGQPSIYNLQAQSLVLSFSQRDYIRGARAALRTAQLSLEDSLDQVALDTALDYIELATIERQLKALEEQKSYAERLGSIEQQRVAAGVESRMNATRAELNAAQADLRRLDLEAQAALLRQRLAHLTGLAAKDMAPQPESIPGEPLAAAADGTGNEAGRGPANEAVNGPGNAGVEAGFSNALARHSIALGDHHQSYRPQVSLGVNYSRYAAFNNYQEYYLRFQHNNFDAGLELQLPLFDAGKQAKARESAADAVRADVQALQGRQNSVEQVVQLSGSLAELRAQQRVARLQDDLAGEQLESVLTQLRDGPAAPGAAALSPTDEMLARIAERQRYVDLLASDLQLTRAELNLLRATGGLGEWLHTPPHTR
jgi:outer membrane protein TolC